MQFFVRLLSGPCLVAVVLFGCDGSSAPDAGPDTPPDAADVPDDTDPGHEIATDGDTDGDAGTDDALDIVPDAAEDGDGSGDDGAGEPSVADFRTGLVAAGFEVQDGALEFPVFDCCSMITCFGNNPSSPYGLYRLPRGPGQTAANPDEEADGSATAWRLRADEAVVFVGRTPPRSAYFGWTAYLYDRARPTLPGREIRFAVEPDPGCCRRAPMDATWTVPPGAPDRRGWCAEGWRDRLSPVHG